MRGTATLVGSGKHQGKHIDLVDDVYLEWMLESLAQKEVVHVVKGKIQHQRKPEKVVCSVHTLLTDLKSSSMKRDLQWGTRIHVKALESSHGSNMFVVTALIKMYAKCGSMDKARRTFDTIQKPDVVCWTVLLQGYAENGDALATLEMFSKMKACGCAPDSVTYVASIKACTSVARKRDGIRRDECLKWGREIHSEIGWDLDIFVQNTLIDMYATCGSLVDAHKVFDSIPKPNVVSWTALLLGYAENGNGLATLELFSKMKACGCAPDAVTYVAALKACTEMRDLKVGRMIHAEIGGNLNIFLQSTLIDMYSKCHSMVDARRVFDSIRKPNVVCWNALLLGYAENGDELATLELFSKMKSCGCSLDSVTYVAGLKACTSLAEKQGGEQWKWLKRGREIHYDIGYQTDIFLLNTLIDMYAKCSSMGNARQVFDSLENPDVVSWNALLLGYVENGEGLTTLRLFSRMKAACAPNSVTYIAALKACGLLGSLALGRKFHSDIDQFSAHVVTCLVDFYGKCGSMEEAWEVFDLHSSARVVATWNALLAGYGSFGDTDSVFNLFKVMQEQGLEPNAITFVCILSCCSHGGLVTKARDYFDVMTLQYGIPPTVMHYTCLVDVFGRANRLKEAISVLQKMPCTPDAITWRTLLGGCCKWKNVEIGRCAFQSLVDMDKMNAPAYDLMAQIYGFRGMWEEQERVVKRRIELGLSKLPGQAYVIDELGNMVKFVDGEEDPPDVRNKLEQLGNRKYDFFAESFMNEVDAEKEETVCGHCDV